jgi:acyl-CoA thioesterase FadM
MNDVVIEFKKELFYGDVVDVAVTATAFERVGFDIVYKLNTHRNGKDIIVAAAKTGMVCFDYNSKKITSVPEEARRKLSAV